MASWKDAEEVDSPVKPGSSNRFSRLENERTPDQTLRGQHPLRISSTKNYTHNQNLPWSPYYNAEKRFRFESKSWDKENENKAKRYFNDSSSSASESENYTSRKYFLEKGQDSIKKQNSEKRRKNHEKLLPLTHFVNDRKKLLSETAKCLDRKSLELILPQKLKGMDQGELEKASLEILKELDSETLLSILEGSELPNESKELTEKKPSIKTSGGKDERKTVDQAATSTSKSSSTETKEDERDNLAREDVYGYVNFMKISTGCLESMDLFELEYRAKAIKSFLKAKGFPVSQKVVCDADEQKISSEKAMKELLNVNADEFEESY